MVLQQSVSITLTTLYHIGVVPVRVPCASAQVERTPLERGGVHVWVHKQQKTRKPMCLCLVQV